MALQRAFGLITALILPLVSCARTPVAVGPAEIDVAESAERLLEVYDADDSGSLSRDEATACCGLASQFDRYDTNQDDHATRDEIIARFRSWAAGDVGIMRVGCRVMLDGRPLSGGHVVFQPHPFLGVDLKQASATTNENGQCSLSVSPDDLPAALQRVRGVQPGLYVVRITHPQVDVPTQYNSDSTLGIEVAGDAIGPDGVEFALSTR